MKNKWIAAGAFFGFLGVAIGAFGAHSLKPLLTPESTEIFKTGVMYQLIHSLVILGIGLYDNHKYSIAGWFFSAGIILFSFSLYVYSLTNNSSFAIVTPFGGVCFLIGWALIIINSLRK